MKAWKELLETLTLHLGPEAIETWLRPMQLLRFDAANVTLKATPFQKAWFDEHVVPLRIPFLNNNQRPIRIHWETLYHAQEGLVDLDPARRSKVDLAERDHRTPYKPSEEDRFGEAGTNLNSQPLPRQGIASKTQVKPSTPLLQIRPDPLDPEFTLQTYLPTNEMGLKMAEDLSLGHAPVFNPVVFFGPSGSGKTHLLTAIAHALQDKRIFLARMQTFTDHVVNAIRLGQMQEFRKAYREIDILIIDDIHELARKNATQEEFFHTFNTLHTLGRQIILSSDRSPAQLQDIEPRLISRFEWGIAIPLTAPTDFASILNAKARRLHLDLSPEISSFLLQRFSHTPKIAINALHALALRTDHIKSCAHAETLLSDLLAKAQSETLTHEKIIRRIADHFGIRPEDITGKSQTREFAQPRQIAMYFCRSLLNTPYQQLGRLFNRDHSTVISSIKQVETATAAKEPPYYEAIAFLARALRDPAASCLSSHS